MPFTLFKKDPSAPMGSLESIQAKASKLKDADKGALPPKATTINLSTTSQPGLGVDGVVIASQDGKAGNSELLRLLIATVRVDRNSDPVAKNDGLPFDCIDSQFFGPLIVPTRQAPSIGKMMAMPRSIAEPGVGYGAAHLLATPFLSVGYFKNAGKDSAEISAASFVPGTRVKMTGLTFEHPKADKEGNEPLPRVKAKRIDIIRKPENPMEADKALTGALQSPAVETFLALSAVPSLGGFEKIGKEAPMLASHLAVDQQQLRLDAACGLKCMASRLENVIAGEGESYAAPACKPASKNALQEMAKELENAEIDAPLGLLLGAPIEIPFIFEGHTPFETTGFKSCPSTASTAPVCSRAHVSSVTATTSVVTLYPTISLAFCGKKALEADGADQPAWYNVKSGSLPSCGIKMTLKNFAPVVGTYSVSKAAMAAEELLPFAPLVVSADVYPLSGDDAIFSDKSGGTNWAQVFCLDLRGALSNVALPVSYAFVKEKYNNGKDTLTEYTPEAFEDKVAATTTPISMPSLETTGVLAVSEKTKDLAEMMEENPDVTFCVLLKGCAEEISKQPSLLTSTEEAEAFLSAKFVGEPKDVKSALVSQTLLFAIKPKPDSSTPMTSEADDVEEDNSASSGGKMTSKGSKKERKEKAAPY